MRFIDHSSAGSRRCLRVGQIVVLSVCSVVGAKSASLYVSNQTTGLVNAYDSISGTLQGTAGTFGSPAGLVVNNGILYVSDASTDTIYSVPLSGAAMSTSVALPANSGVYDVAFDGSGNAFVTALTAGLVYKYNSSGVQQGSPVAVARPRGIAFDGVSGNLYVVSTPNSDGSSGTDAIVQLSTGLTVLNPTFITGKISAPRFIQPDQYGNLAISNAGSGGTTGFISGFGPNGTFFANIATGLSSPNEMASPGGYAIDVVDNGDNTVQNCPGSGAPCTALISPGGGASGTLGLASAPHSSFPRQHQGPLRHFRRRSPL